ncbi:MAG: sugar-binding domain-containing protein [Bacteroidales bacterium]
MQRITNLYHRQTRSSFLLLLMMLLLITVSGCSLSEQQSRDTIDLSGTWEFQLDPSNLGEQEEWFSKELSDTIQLPGSTDFSKKGSPNRDRSETSHLTRRYPYTGKAWYSKEVRIPAGWKGSQVRLILERTKPSMVWVDGVKAGTSTDITTPQRHDLSTLLTPGQHRITLLIDNGGSVPDAIRNASHAYVEHTQTNWNGVIGKIALESTATLFIDQIRTFPDIEKREVTVEVVVDNRGDAAKRTIRLSAGAWNSPIRHNLKQRSFPVEIASGTNSFRFTYPMGQKAQLWSPDHPVLYRLEGAIVHKAGKVDDRLYTHFGLRQFKTEGTQFTLNGQRIFLRGKNDACVFPLTGYPPMDTASWRQLFRIAKTYGINHYRFHSWSPPEAAFLAADMEGILLQPELPFWGSLQGNNQPLLSFLRKEGKLLLSEYANHASLVMFALGNEISGHPETITALRDTLRQFDNRPLMATGSNNFLGFRGAAPGDDYFTTCRVGGENPESFNTHTRSSFSFADAWQGGLLNGMVPNSRFDYSGAIAACTVPVISHETGQFQIYPDYSEIAKYNGVLAPRNLEIFRERLVQAGMGSQADTFFKASGSLSVLCYKADIEMALRTPGFGGFQLLDLQDFPGQGTALVGILNAFMESKNLITPKKFREFCSEVVPLLRIDRFCFSAEDTLKGAIQVAQYSALTLRNQRIHWEVRQSDGGVMASGDTFATLRPGLLIDLCSLAVPLAEIASAEQLSVEIELTGTPYRNSYPIWVYPTPASPSIQNGILITQRADAKMMRELADGKRVLLLPEPDAYQKVTIGGLFTPDYWNYRMFKGISENGKRPVSPGTLGLLIRNDHPLFKEFPTDFHSNWQWWNIVKESRPLILNAIDSTFRPIVQPIDNIERNYRLGMLFECKVGAGKLIVCMSPLQKLTQHPECQQLYHALLNYMRSEAFDPSFAIDPEALELLFRGSAEPQMNYSGVENISYQ